MKKLIPILSIVVLWPFAESWAQLAPPNAAGVSMGHIRIIARDVEAEKKIWSGLGGTLIKVDGMDVVKFPGAFIFITQGVPTRAVAPGAGVMRITTEVSPDQEEGEGKPGLPQFATSYVPLNVNNEGNVINHIAFRVQTGKGIIEKLQAQGVRVSLNQASLPDKADVFSTEYMRIETVQGTNQREPVVADHLHFDMPRFSRREALAWYAGAFGVKTKAEGEGMFGELPGLPGGLIFGQVVGDVEAPLPSMGYTLDRIGFEVVNLEAFCKKLVAMGIIFEYPYSKTRYPSFASAGLTDPWGAAIELTEGLNRF